MRHVPRVTDVNQMFARAEAAFGAGRLAEAGALAGEVLRAAGDHPAVLHLCALVEKRTGNLEAAERAFVHALCLAPHDPQIRNNYGNLLDEAGRTDDALVQYDRALQASASFADARLNRAILLQRLGRLEEALGDLDTVIRTQPVNPRAHSARGTVLLLLERHASAAAAYDRALALAPAHRNALAGRARVALDRGEPGAADRYRAALAVHPDSPELILGLSDALEAEGDAEGLRVLQNALALRPGWIEGHERLAEKLAETGAGGELGRSYRDALAVQPTNRDLHRSYWRSLALAERFDEALAAVAATRAVVGDDRELRLAEAAFLSETGEPDRADRLFALLGDDPAVLLARARTLLRRKDAAQAALLFERLVADRLDDISAWAFLGLAWRLVGDPRHEWLCEQPGLYGTVDLRIDEARLGAIADVLRRLHRTRAHPIGQSLRGGTQTRGRLFRNLAPEIAELRAAVTDAVARFVERLPPPDPTHPLLRHRDKRLEVLGSWSVRLLSSGFHINHVHPQGVLSSACYIALPPSLGTDGAQDGWLQLGAPPVELDLPLAALATLEPRPGRLALFPSYLYHGTLPFRSGERLTVAFDIAAR